MTDEYVVACYDMSLKEFEHSAVCDLFKVCYLTFSLSCLLHFSCLEFLFFFFFFKKKKKKKKYFGNVKVHCSVQVGHKDGQDEDTRG